VLNKVDLIELTLCLQVSQLCLHSVFKLVGHGCMCIANHTHAAKSQFTLQTKLQRRITLQVFFYVCSNLSKVLSTSPYLL